MVSFFSFKHFKKGHRSDSHSGPFLWKFSGSYRKHNGSCHLILPQKLTGKWTEDTWIGFQWSNQIFHQIGSKLCSFLLCVKNPFFFAHLTVKVTSPGLLLRQLLNALGFKAVLLTTLWNWIISHFPRKAQIIMREEEEKNKLMSDKERHSLWMLRVRHLLMSNPFS